MIYEETITQKFNILCTFLLCLIEGPKYQGICLWSWQPFSLYIDSEGENHTEAGWKHKEIEQAYII